MSGKQKFVVHEDGERELFYSNNRAETRCIGHLRGDFGRGNEFWTTWWPHNEAMVTQEFKSELDAFVNQLRANLLKNRASMYKYLADHPVKPLDKAMSCSYGYHSLSMRYEFYIRCTPEPWDYNFYIYCYKKLEDV